MNFHANCDNGEVSGSAIAKALGFLDQLTQN